MVNLEAVEEGYLNSDEAMVYAEKASKEYKLYYVGCQDDRYIIKQLILKMALAKMYSLIAYSNFENRRWTEKEIKEELDKFVGAEVIYYFEHKYDDDPHVMLAY